MSCKIGVIWSSLVSERDCAEQEDVLIIPNVRMDEVKEAIALLLAREAEIIVGTPGTEAEIRRYTTVPVVIVTNSYIDTLETILEAWAVYGGRHDRAALILHAGNAIDAERLQPFVKGLHLALFSYNDEQHLRAVLETAASQGYPLIIGGPTAVSLARARGLDAAALRHHLKSLAEGIQKARDILALIDKERYQVESLRTVLNIIPEGIVVTNEQGEITMGNAQMSTLLGVEQRNLIGANVTQLLNDESWSEVYRRGAVQNDCIVDHQRTRYFSTRRPIIEKGRAVGSVGTLQAVDKIQTMERTYRSLQSRGLTARYHFFDIIGESEAIRELVERTELYARFDMTVLIEGETGTGKELFAQSIHNASPRQTGPFVAINCAALAESLLESELMGYDEGAFTGARKGGKMGLFEQARNGTIFLDEINQMSMSLQAKVLRVLQERTVLRIGGDRVIPINVRIITASNERLLERVLQKTFRSDLYYRINVLNFRIPPLRERPEDVLPLIRSFCARRAQNPLVHPLCPEEIHRPLAEYHWPGNVRELQNYVERCLVLGAGHLNRRFFSDFLEAIPTCLEEAAPLDGPIQVAPGRLADMEQQLIRAIVERCAGNKSKAALQLDINRATVHSKL